MDANLNFLTATNANTAPTGASGINTSVDPNLSKPMSGKEFAGLMRDLMQQGERQEVAAMRSIDAATAEATALQTLSLGSQFAVITSTSPLPDTNSLAAFARAQGLSETAVETLFGDLSQSIPKPSGLLEMPSVFSGPSLTDTSAGLSDLALLTGMTYPTNGASNGVLNELQPTLTPALTPALTPSFTATDTLTLLPSAAPLSWIQAQTQNLTANELNGGNLPSTSPAVTTKASDLTALIQTAGATGVLQSMGPVGPTQSNTLGHIDNPVDIPPELGPLDAMRMRMIPAWENMTRQLAKLNGIDQGASWGQLSANLLNSKGKVSDIPEVLLDLNIDDANDLSIKDTFSSDMPNNGLISLDSARNTASSGALGSAATSAALASPEMTDRAAQIQDLADKLGKAMGQRLQEQMDRGEWKLQLKLNPAHLGKIDVELDMNGGALDAVFKTDNLLTRELIAQSMPKLKDSLAQSGMTVANVWLNSGNHRESGGNSTPRQQTAPGSTVNASETKVSATETRTQDLRSSDAWDTLA
jgi:hypothetical protein